MGRMKTDTTETRHHEPAVMTAPTRHEVRSASRRRRSTSWLLAGAVGALLTTVTAGGQAAVITDPNPSSNVWMTGNEGITEDNYVINAAAGLFSPATFAIDTFLDAQTGDFNTPYGVLTFPNGTNMQANNGYSRVGTLFGPTSFYENGPYNACLNTSAFTDGAVAGSNNYVGIEVKDTNGLEHYGWLEYSLAAFSNDTPAVVFDAGYLNDVAGVPVTTGVVPEPSTDAVLLGALGVLLGVRCWRQRDGWKMCA